MISRGKMGSLLLLGLAAFGAYKYSKMNEQQKKDLLNKGKQLVSDKVDGISKAFNKKPQFAHSGNGTV